MWKIAVTVQTILRFPDPHLRATAQRVVVFDEDLCSLATDLLDTLRAASIGITAPRIGVLKPMERPAQAGAPPGRHRRGACSFLSPVTPEPQMNPAKPVPGTPWGSSSPSLRAPPTWNVGPNNYKREGLRFTP